ncbi:MAG: NADH:flavin oxidoreductase/NADH oxidase [Micavibrio sp.]|nr:NADH:flavin oxidoreductase/NADH oxidase [Micavibrio sp.]
MTDTPLFTPFKMRNLTLRNRIGISPMCQYSAVDGFANDWHLAHLGARAAGGAGLIIMEATGVSPEGRITPGCHGIWKDEHIPFLKRLTDFVKSQGAAIGIQLGHAGRKASCALPWDGGKALAVNAGGWQTVAPSAIAFSDESPVPQALDKAGIAKVIADFVAAAKRSVDAGFQVLELHGAHGYLLHEFLSPFSNARTDEYGGSEENRFRFVLETFKAVRAAVPDDIVVGIRLSCSEWVEGGFDVDSAVRLATQLKALGADFIDCSSGGNIPHAKIPSTPGYQVPFAHKIRAEAKLPVAAVGIITEAVQANELIAKGDADLVFIARASLRDPHWALNAAVTLGADVDAPSQYLRGYNASRTTAAKRKAG